MNITYSLTDLESVAKKIIAQYEKPKTLLFYGEMGVGKTTLIKVLAHELGVTEATTSPTFSLVNEYQGRENTIFHFDFYRINDEVEVYDIGIEDYFYQNAWCFVEWSEKIPNLLPQDAIVIKIAHGENQKRVLEIAPQV